MNILHISPSYKPAFVYGGPTLSISGLCEALVARNVGVTVYTTTANGGDELECERGKALTVDGVTVYYFKRLTKDHTHFSPALLLKLWKTVREFDAVHVHAWWNLVSVLSVLVCVLRGVKPVLSPRGMLGEFSKNTGRGFSKQLMHISLGRWLLKKVIFHTSYSRNSNF